VRRRQFLVASLMSALPSARSQAQNWPAPVTRFVVPYAPGSAIDTPARLIAERLTGALAATFIVENRPGAGGAVGAQAVAQGAADGSVFLVTSSSVSILPALQPHLGFDPLRDLQPVSLVCDVPSALLVRKEAPFSSVPDLLAQARATPGKLTYGSGGVGSSNHLAGALFASLANIDIIHVPYRGTGQTINALYAGEIDLMFAPTLDVLGHVKQGRVRALGTTLPQRVPALPDVPAISEFVAGYAVSNWFAIFAPAHLPPSVRDRLVDALEPLRDWPALKERFAEGAAVVRLDGPAALAQRMTEDTARWGQLIAKLGIKPE
jgi:tripartite-type tricarboxylate transporter receptor subunit TctC